ncbi:MAG: hypothetical protein EA423_06070 [Phycisphaerales bacterium]|nr:MAG: hypothetical protein EA423_06070 [Phycisphaerales bacterium]
MQWLALLLAINVLLVLLMVYLLVQQQLVVAFTVFAVGTLINFGLSMLIAKKYRDAIVSSRDRGPPGT